MYRTIFAIVFLSNVYNAAEGQNLVPNPSFEEFDQCPSDCSEPDTMLWYVNDQGKKAYRAELRSFITSWEVPAGGGTPDYFNPCNKSDAGVPSNYFGNMAAKDGKAYMGLILWGWSTDKCESPSTFPEYVRTKLKVPLQKDSLYCVSLYYSLAENSGVVTDQLGVYISKTIEDVANDDDRKTSFNMKPASVETPEGVALQNSGQWNQMCGVYKAAGGEEFITISRYAPRKSDFTRRHVKVKGLANAAYYYIDNVQVVPISKDASCVCELSEKEKMELWTRKLKDGNTLELEDIQFDFNKSDLLPASYTALNTLVTILKAEPSMKIEIDGHTDAEGTKERNLELSKERARAVAAYLVSKGIDKTRIQTKGYGDTQPKSDNQTKHGRAINRRVEVKIVR